MSELPHLHKPGELITIRWPNGPHDFKIQFEYANDDMQFEGWEGWVTLYGVVGAPGGHQTLRGFYCHPIGDREYEMIPRKVD